MSSNDSVVSTVSQLPKGVCVKVGSLRPRYKHLKHWSSTPGNVLITRYGRVFITENDKKEVFSYKGSEWANPFKLSEYTLEESLQLYEEHLNKLLMNEKCLQRFLQLRNVKEIGCFCDPQA